MEDWDEISLPQILWTLACDIMLVCIHIETFIDTHNERKHGTQQGT